VRHNDDDGQQIKEVELLH